MWCCNGCAHDPARTQLPMRQRSESATCKSRSCADNLRPSSTEPCSQTLIFAVTELARLQPPVAAALAVAGAQLARCRALRGVSLQLTGSVVAPALSTASEPGREPCSCHCRAVTAQGILKKPLHAYVLTPMPCSHLGDRTALFLQTPPEALPQARALPASVAPRTAAAGCPQASRCR